MMVAERKSEVECRSCRKSKARCDKRRPRCSKCIETAKTFCDYSFVLRWGRHNKRKYNKNSMPHKDIVISDGASKEICSGGDNLELCLDRALGDTNDNFSDGTPTNTTDLGISLDDMAPSSFHKDLLWESMNIFPLPYPMISVNTHQSTALSFFIQETSSLFTVVPPSMFSSPFWTVLPQIALESPTLMNMMLEFGECHRNSIVSPYPGAYNDTDTFSFDSKINRTHLNKIFTQLLTTLTDDNERYSDSTMATLLLLTAYAIVFDNKGRTWRSHLRCAHAIFIDRLKSKSLTTCDMKSKRYDLNVEAFFASWLYYLEVMTSLSSIKGSDDPTDSTYLFSLLFWPSDEQFLERERSKLRDIECSSGLETKTLIFLADVDSLIKQKESVKTNQGLRELQLKAYELEHAICKYLAKSETQRDNISSFYKDPTSGMNSSQMNWYQSYKVLRATNMIYALTGRLLLKRRILEIPPSSPIIRDLLLSITELIEKYVSLGSSEEACLLFCIYCCGAEMLDESLASRRGIYLAHLDNLESRGISSAKQAKIIIQECWKSQASWWEVLQDRNFDIVFVI